MKSKFRLTIYPDSVLREPSLPVYDMDDAFNNMVQGMKEIMYKFRGIGLAAPQVGVLQRVVIADIGQRFISLVNPEILQKDGQERREEGCLSLPDVRVDIARSLSILVRGIDQRGKEIDLELSGLTARVIQHEIDHLNGVLIIDYASMVEKYLFG